MMKTCIATLLLWSASIFTAAPANADEVYKVICNETVCLKVNTQTGKTWVLVKVDNWRRYKWLALE